MTRHDAFMHIFGLVLQVLGALFAVCSGVLQARAIRRGTDGYGWQEPFRRVLNRAKALAVTAFGPRRPVILVGPEVTSRVGVSDKVVLELITPLDSAASDAERFDALERFAKNERKERLAAERRCREAVAEAHGRITAAEECLDILRAEHAAAQKVAAIGTADLQIAALYCVMGGTFLSALGGVLTSV